MCGGAPTSRVPDGWAPDGRAPDGRVAEAAGPRVMVNGRPRELGEVGGHVTLLEWLRGSGLTGCKEGCAEGECGACAVLVARDDGPDRTRWVAINACLVPAAAFDQQEVVTAEGLGQPGRLHPVQREMADRGGSQCGYCTPGFICSMAAEYYRPGRQPAVTGAPGHGPNGSGSHATANGERPPGDDDAGEHGPNGFDLHALSGNLCRCTGYRPIRDAAYALGQPAADDPFLARLAAPAPAPAATTSSNTQGRYVRPAEPGRGIGTAGRRAGRPAGGGVHRLGRRAEHQAHQGRAERRHRPDRRAARAHRGPGQHRHRRRAEPVRDRGPARPGRVPLLGQLFPQFASRLIRNGATLGGNLGTASPIGDTPPALLALDAALVLASSRGEREVPLAEYFTGYRQSVKRPDELIKTIRIPLPVAPVTAFHKIAKRRFDDISGVAVAYALRLGPDRSVESIRIGLGGVAATPIRALAAEQALAGRPWTREVVAAAAEEMAGAGTPMSDHRASQAYRIAMLRNSLLKFCAQTQQAGPTEGASHE